MKIAVICLAYLRLDAGVRMLSDYFAKLDADLFVHVDAKVSFETYEASSACANVHFVKKRVPVYWGGFNTVCAIIKTIEIARERAHYDRFVLLTEDSVPLRPPAELLSCLSDDIEWIDSHELPEERWQRYTGFFCFDTPATNPRFFDPADKFFTEEHLNKINRLQALMALGKFNLRRLCSGSGYWALSAKAVSAVLETHFTSQHFRHSFEFSAIPEEQYFHTILANAGLASKRRRFMRADFDRPPHPYVYRTAAELYAEQRDSKCLFLRKVDLTKPEVIDYVARLAQTS
jgi:hypothetical protein